MMLNDDACPATRRARFACASKPTVALLAEVSEDAVIAVLQQGEMAI
jgi:hypothetical protein